MFMHPEFLMTMHSYQPIIQNPRFNAGFLMPNSIVHTSNEHRVRAAIHDHYFCSHAVPLTGVGCSGQ